MSAAKWRYLTGGRVWRGVVNTKLHSPVRVQRTHKKEGGRRVKGDKKLQALGQSFLEDDAIDHAPPPATSERNGSDKEAGRKTSVAKAVVQKILYNPNRKNLAAAHSQSDGVGGANTNLVDQTPPTPRANRLKGGGAGGGASGGSGHNQLRFTRADYRVIRLSTDSLLSIVSEFCLYYSRRGMPGSVAAARKHSTSRKMSVAYVAGSMTESTSRVSLDPPSVAVSPQCGGGTCGGARIQWKTSP